MHGETLKKVVQDFLEHTIRYEQQRKQTYLSFRTTCWKTLKWVWIKVKPSSWVLKQTLKDEIGRNRAKREKKVKEEMQWIDHLNQHSVTHPSQSLSDGPLSELFAPGVKYLHFTRENSLHPLSLAWTTTAENRWTDGHIQTCHPGHGVALRLFRGTKSTYPKLLTAEDAQHFMRKGTDVINW